MEVKVDNLEQRPKSSSVTSNTTMSDCEENEEGKISTPSKRKRKRRANRNQKTGRNSNSIGAEGYENNIEFLISQRPPISELITKNILRDEGFLPVKGKRSDNFQRFIESRPAREDLVNRNYIAESKLANSLYSTQQELIRKMNMINVSKSLKNRPTKDYLVTKNIIRGDSESAISIEKKEETIQALLQRRPTVQELIASNILQHIYIWARVDVPLDNRPAARNCHTLTACNERLYLFGGANSGRSSAIVNSFDFNSNRWVSTEADGPAPNRRYAHSAVEIDGKIFYFGGYASHGYGHVGRWMNDLHTLNVPPLVLESDFPTTNPTSPLEVTWDRIYLVPRPEARAAHSCCSLGKDMLLFGGNDGEKLFNDSWMLDTVNMKWKQLITNGTAPSPRSGHSASAIKNRVFIFGGGSYNGSTLNDLHVLDVNTFFWYRPTFDGTAPSPRAGHTSTVIGHKVFIFGGGDRGRVYNDLFLFDTIHMNWSRPTDTGLLPSPRVGHSISTVGQHLLVFGGGDSEGILFNDMYALDTGSIRDSIVVSNDSNSEGKKDDRRLSSGSVGDEKREGSGVKSKSWAAVVGGVSDPPPATASHSIHDSVVGERPLDFASQINLITDMIESKIEEQDREWGKLMDMVLEAHRQGKSDREQIVLELNRLKSLLNS